MNDRIKYYVPIDYEGLATALAEEAWEEEVKAKGLTRDDLYGPIVTYSKHTPLQEQIRPEWAHTFFALRDGYLRLINMYKIIPDEI